MLDGRRFSRVREQRDFFLFSRIEPKNSSFALMQTLYLLTAF